MNSLCIAIAVTLAVFVLTEAEEKRGACFCDFNDLDFSRSVITSLSDDRNNCRKDLRAGEASFTPVSALSDIDSFLRDNICCGQYGWYNQIGRLVYTINECIDDFNPRSGMD